MLAIYGGLVWPQHPNMTFAILWETISWTMWLWLQQSLRWKTESKTRWGLWSYDPVGSDENSKAREAMPESRLPQIWWFTVHFHSKTSSLEKKNMFPDTNLWPQVKQLPCKWLWSRSNWWQSPEGPSTSLPMWPSPSFTCHDTTAALRWNGVSEHQTLRPRWFTSMLFILSQYIYIYHYIWVYIYLWLLCII